MVGKTPLGVVVVVEVDAEGATGSQTMIAVVSFVP